MLQMNRMDREDYNEQVWPARRRTAGRLCMWWAKDVVRAVTWGGLSVMTAIFSGVYALKAMNIDLKVDLVIQALEPTNVDTFP